MLVGAGRAASAFLFSLKEIITCPPKVIFMLSLKSEILFYGGLYVLFLLTNHFDINNLEA
jgi:hypothetical protein